MYGLQGIVPTLMFVRTGLGISTEDAQTAILTSRIQFDHIAEDAEEADTSRPDMMPSTGEGQTLPSTV